MPLRNMVAYLVKSPYLLCIAVLVLAYNLSVNLIEVVWKDQVKCLYPDPAAYSAFQGKVTIATDIIATLASLFLCGNTIRRFGWTVAALMTPVIILVTSFGFFGGIFFKETLWFSSLMILLGTTPTAVVVMFGTLQSCFTRAAKFSMFDATKEMAFVPLSRESRLKGKAAIDGVGSRLGKSGSAVLHSGLLMIFSSIGASAPYVGILLPIVVGGWILAVRSLGKQFQALTSPKDPISPLSPSDLPLNPEPQPVRS